MLPQWQQKIALRAENPSGRCLHCLEHPLYFMPEGQFFAGIGPAIFRIVRRAIEAHVSNPFSPPFLVITRFCYRIIEKVAAKIQRRFHISKKRATLHPFSEKVLYLSPIITE